MGSAATDTAAWFCCLCCGPQQHTCRLRLVFVRGGCLCCGPQLHTSRPRLLQGRLQHFGFLFHFFHRIIIILLISIVHRPPAQPRPPDQPCPQSRSALLRPSRGMPARIKMSICYITTLSVYCLCVTCSLACVCPVRSFEVYVSCMFVSCIV